jgi:hypothetical protein
MTDTKREDELKRIPAQSGRSDLPPGKLRSISMDKIDLLQVDRNGRLYWDGKPVEVSRRLTFWQSVGGIHGRHVCCDWKRRLVPSGLDGLSRFGV